MQLIVNLHVPLWVQAGLDVVINLVICLLFKKHFLQSLSRRMRMSLPVMRGSSQAALEQRHSGFPRQASQRSLTRLSSRRPRVRTSWRPLVKRRAEVTKRSTAHRALLHRAVGTRKSRCVLMRAPLIDQLITQLSKSARASFAMPCATELD